MTGIQYRKSCDMCHVQKLICKRTGDADCERCKRASRPCTSSPSLRYGKRRRGHQDTSGTLDTKKPRLSLRPISIQPTTNLVPNDSATRPITQEKIDQYGAVSSIDYGAEFEFGNALELEGFCNPIAPACDTQLGVNPAFEEFLAEETRTEKWTFDSMSSWPLDSTTTANSPMPTPPQSDVGIFVEPTPSSDQLLNADDDLIATNGISITETQNCIPWEQSVHHINAKICRMFDFVHRATSNYGSTAGFTQSSRFLNRFSDLQELSVEELFQLSNDFLRILDTLYKSKVEMRQTSRNVDNPDVAGWLLLLSVYLRILDVYEIVFSPLTESGARDQLSLEASRLWRLPQVIVGSMEIEFSPELRLSLIIKMAKQCLGRLSNSVARVFHGSQQSREHREDEKLEPGAEIVVNLFKFVSRRETCIDTRLLEALHHEA
ncbi:uncharacterized protein BCR38DRAFT_477813 [Pseudomassariella vexata]|uniref:Zn(2)-C6 fungal-type domain-containing protein n=1 Tax=Pseudomassariella vexata TaxID=1141098 RepID=A0A1Y2DGV4_9PEZI|nr:uncharacterized protein BCR38DRAFT_477813 [Pseudomassariella vexata]ORY58488.1 hypothetical protein BCR38DRAFT_477813 [Pseudomassariella vexata]